MQIHKVIAAAFLLFLSLAGCASSGGVRPESVKVIRTGDVADIHFLCKLRTGEIVAATDKLEGQQAALPRSGIFLVRSKDGPVPVKAADALPALPPGGERAFEAEIIDRLGEVLVGMKEGESRAVNLTAEELPERKEEAYVVKLVRVRENPKEMKMTINEYRSRTGKSPEVGQSVIFDTKIPGHVETITEGEVVIRFSAQAGDTVATPFGPGRIRETEKTYEIVIDAQKGALIRTAHLVGRISEVDENSITLDYRNPFGGESIICDVAVEKIEAAKSAKKAELEGGEK